MDSETLLVTTPTALPTSNSSGNTTSAPILSPRSAIMNLAGAPIPTMGVLNLGLSVMISPSPRDVILLSRTSDPSSFHPRSSSSKIFVIMCSATLFFISSKIALAACIMVMPYLSLTAPIPAIAPSGLPLSKNPRKTITSVGVRHEWIRAPLAVREASSSSITHRPFEAFIISILFMGPLPARTSYTLASLPLRFLGSYPFSAT